jgi:hypothetical protein
MDWVTPAEGTRGFLTLLAPIAGAVATVMVGDALGHWAGDWGRRVIAGAFVCIAAVPAVRWGTWVTRTHTPRLVGATVVWVRSGQGAGRVFWVALTGCVLAMVWGHPLGHAFTGALFLLLFADVWARTSRGHHTHRSDLLTQAWEGQRAGTLTRVWDHHLAGIVQKDGRWVTRKGVPATKLTRSSLTQVNPLPDGGFRAVVALPTHTTATWRDLTVEAPRIAKAYGTSTRLVFAGPYRTGSARHGDLTVCHTDPLADPVPWREPSLNRHGLLTMGVLGNGDPLTTHLWRPGTGTPHWFISGATTTGKSSPVAVALMEAALSGRFVTILMDPAGGSSVPGFTTADAHRVTYFAAGPDDCLRMLRALAALTDALMAAGLVRGTPTRQTPGVLAFLDEAPVMLLDSKDKARKAFAAEARGYVSHLVRVGAKAKVSLGLCTQMPTIDQLGGEGAIRDQLISGHTYAFRSLSRNGVTALPGVSFADLAAIPQGQPGTGIHEGSSMLGRTLYADATSLATYDRLLTERGPWPVLPPPVHAAFTSALEGDRS